MSTFWELLVALAQSWVSLMSGAAGLAMTVYGLVKRSELTGRLFVGVGIVSLLVALGMTWATEHLVAEDAKQKLTQADQKLRDLTKPQFVLMLPDIAYRYSPKRQAAIILLGVEIINKGADSAALYWQASYKTSTLSRAVEVTRLPDRPPFFSIPLPSQGTEMIFQGSAAINVQTAPIPRGGVRTGRLPLRVPGDQVEEIRTHRPEIAVTVQDYVSTRYTATFQYGGTKPSTIRVFPGEEVIPRQD